MTKQGSHARGVALYLVISSLFIALILSSVILRTVLNQTRLTHHGVSRIQAYYASYGALNYSFAKIREGVWPIPALGSAAVSYTMCRRNSLGVCTCNYCDDEIAMPISVIVITFDNSNTGPNNTLRVSASATYTYIPDAI